MPAYNPAISRSQGHAGNPAYDRVKRDPGAINLSTAESYHGPPDNIIQAYKHALDQHRVHYGSMKGELELREAIAENAKNQYGIEVDPENEVIATSGGSGALFAAIWTFIGEGDELVTPDPTYPAIFEKTRLLGGVPISCPRGKNFEVLPGELEKKITKKTKMIALVDPDNPTGAVCSKKTVEEIAAIAQEHDLVVLSDQVYDRILYDGVKHYSIIAAPGMKERTILVNSFSKSFGMSGLRIGYAIMSKETMKYFFQIQANDNPHPSVPAQLAAAAALRGSKEFLHDWLEEFEWRRNLVVDSLNAIDGVSCHKPKGGLVVFPDVSQLGSSADVSERLLEAKVVAYPGTWYGRYGEGHIRLCFASVGIELLREALRKIKDLFEK